MSERRDLRELVGDDVPQEQLERLERKIGGMRDMTQLPGALFVIDPKREELLVKEANRLKIPVVALTDTNCDPEVVDYVIPGNDDAIRSISLISRLIADAVVEARGEEAVSSGDRPLPPAVEGAQVPEKANEAILAEEAAEAVNGAPETAEPEAGPSAEVDEPEAVGSEGGADADAGSSAEPESTQQDEAKPEGAEEPPSEENEER